MIRPNAAPVIAAAVILLFLYTSAPFSSRSAAPSPGAKDAYSDPLQLPVVEIIEPSHHGYEDDYDIFASTSASQGQAVDLETDGQDESQNAPVLPEELSDSLNYNDYPWKPATTSQSNEDHPIPRLIREADLHFRSLLDSQSQTLEQAAKVYREKRGRHPPPGFDLWFEYAKDNDAIIVEEFWDQIYHDLEPFWAINPALIRAQARAQGMAVMIKDGHTDTNTDWFWHVIWKKMLDEVAYMLPDMVIPMNAMDEPRLMVPYDKIAEHVATAHEQKKMPDASTVRRNVQGWREKADSDAPEIPKVEWHVVPPYSFAREACPPSSPIRGDYKLYNSGDVPLPQGASKNGMASHRFVENSTLWSDTCQDPAIAAYHGALISPLSGSTSQTLIPLFGGSKFSVNNEILLPAPMYWNGEERFEQADTIPWSEKSNTVMWRGTATGGRHNALNWPHFHRHRFVALANGTKHDLATEHGRIFTPAQKQAAIDPLPSQVQSNLGPWLNKHNNVAFTDLFCDIPAELGKCWYLDEEFTVAPGLSLASQYSNKYLPDIDGNSFSGRYRSFLQSGSLPIKATLYREWHDTRLVAWKHFVPMNNRFTDYYSLLEYFVGCEADICGEEGAIAGHDSEAESIAKTGSEWAKKVLRKVDMQIYMARVMLEYGRIADDHRELVGWVNDLTGGKEEPLDNAA